MRLKRAFDLLLVALSLPLALPLLVMVALMVWLKLGLPVLFRQPRPGYKGRVFTLYKFRTMTETRDGSGKLLPDEQRLTRLGGWLRRTSLDELPELFNIVRGEMSWVGPRPLLVQYLNRYSPEQMRRHNVLPGLTGWAQLNGRNALTWEEKFQLDLWYVDHGSVLLDCRILWKSLFCVLCGRGVNAPGQATMPEFLGSLAPRSVERFRS